MYVLFDVLNDYSREKVTGKFQFGDLAHAKKRAQDDTYKMYEPGGRHKKSAYKIKWYGNQNPESGSSATAWRGAIHDGELVYEIRKMKNNPITEGQLESFVYEMDGSGRDELKDALKVAVAASKDYSISGAKRIIYRDLAKILRKEIKKFSPSRNPAIIKPGEAPYKHKGYEIWNMGGRHWAYRKPRTDKYIGEFKTVVAAMQAIDKIKPGAVCPRCKRKTFSKVKTGGAECYVCGFGKLRPGQKGYKKNPDIEIRELILFSENSPSLHNQYVSIMKNLSRKKKRGIYDPVLAAKLWKYWIDEGVKQYNLEVLGGGRSLVQNVFTMEDRKQAAIEMEDQEQEGVFSMEYLKANNPCKRKKNPATVNRERFLLMVKEILKFTKDEMFAFSTKHQRGRGAMGLGFSGKGSRTLVNDLANFAANMGAAKGTTGDTKKMYERIAHDILTDATKTEYKTRKKNLVTGITGPWILAAWDVNNVAYYKGPGFKRKRSEAKTYKKESAAQKAGKRVANEFGVQVAVANTATTHKQLQAALKPGKV